MSTIRNICVLIGLYLFSDSVHPSWWQQVYQKVDQNHYYVGTSQGQKNLNKGLDEAYKNAIKEAIRHQIGLQSSLTGNYSSTEKRLLIREEFLERYPRVTLKDITPDKERVLKVEGEYLIYRRIKVGKNFIKSIEENLSTQRYHKFGKTTRASLKIITTPPEATVKLINMNSPDEYLGTTDAIFNVSPGNYKMTLTKPGYQAIEEEVSFYKELSIKRQLVKEKCDLEIVTIPSHVRVTVNGRQISTKNLSLDCLTTYKIGFLAPRYLSEVKEVYLVEKSNNQIHLSLKKKLPSRESSVWLSPEDKVASGPTTLRLYSNPLIYQSSTFSAFSFAGGAFLTLLDKFSLSTEIRIANLDRGENYRLFAVSANYLFSRLHTVQPYIGLTINRRILQRDGQKLEDQNLAPGLGSFIRLTKQSGLYSDLRLIGTNNVASLSSGVYLEI